MKVALNPAELRLIMDALDDKHQFQLQSEGGKGRGGWSREALTPSAGYRTVTQKGKVPVSFSILDPQSLQEYCTSVHRLPRPWESAGSPLGRGAAKGQRAGPLLGRSDERDLDVDVAACRLGVRADAVRRIDQLSREVAVDARKPSVTA